jgi:hypothetical protein
VAGLEEELLAIPEVDLAVDGDCAVPVDDGGRVVDEPVVPELAEPADDDSVRGRASSDQAAIEGPSDGSAHLRASSGDSKTYPDVESSGRTTRRAPAATAERTASRVSSRLLSRSPTTGAIC